MTSRSLSPRYRARLAPATRLVWAPFMHVARCVYSQGSSVTSLVSAEYPSTKQILTCSHSVGLAFLHDKNP